MNDFEEARMFELERKLEKALEREQSLNDKLTRIKEAVGKTYPDEDYNVADWIKGVNKAVSGDVQTFCPTCRQIDIGQHGEYPCPECDLPTLYDNVEAGDVVSLSLNKIILINRAEAFEEAAEMVSNAGCGYKLMERASSLRLQAGGL